MPPQTSGKPKFMMVNHIGAEDSHELENLEHAFREYLPDGLTGVFHEEGPWQQFPEAVHKWGYRNY
jgi:hypothetical protein